MSKNPLIQYYAAILSISQLEGNGDAFTRQYDKICRVLTKEQVQEFFAFFREILENWSKVIGVKLLQIVNPSKVKLLLNTGLFFVVTTEKKPRKGKLL